LVQFFGTIFWIFGVAFTRALAGHKASYDGSLSSSERLTS